MEQKTTMAISNKLWSHLIKHKQNPQETHEDVIWRYIKGDKNEKNENNQKE